MKKGFAYMRFNVIGGWLWASKKLHRFIFMQERRFEACFIACLHLGRNGKTTLRKHILRSLISLVERKVVASKDTLTLNLQLFIYYKGSVLSAFKYCIVLIFYPLTCFVSGLMLAEFNAIVPKDFFKEWKHS